MSAYTICMFLGLWTQFWLNVFFTVSTAGNASADFELVQSECLGTGKLCAYAVELYVSYVTWQIISNLIVRLLYL